MSGCSTVRACVYASLYVHTHVCMQLLRACVPMCFLCVHMREQLCVAVCVLVWLCVGVDSGLCGCGGGYKFLFICFGKF